MVKRIVLLVATVFAAVDLMAAAVSIDGYGAFVGTQDAQWQFGGGGALGVEVAKNINILYRGMYTTGEKSKSIYITTIPYNYTHMMNCVGVEYVFPIDKARLGWRSSVQLGYSSTSLDTTAINVSSNLDALAYIGNPNAAMMYLQMLSISKTTLKDNGVCLAFWTGIQWQAKQFIALFADVGFHRSFYSNALKSNNIHGLHTMFGVRFTVGHSRSLKKDY